MIKTRTVQVDDDVKSVLADAQIEGNVVRIVTQLDRDLYVRVNKVLEALGGKWNRKLRGHVFDGDPAVKIAQAVGTGKAVDIKKSVEFFETPAEVGHLLILKASIEPGMKVLEPSAGRGALADLIRDACPDCELDVVELEEANRKALKEKGYKIVGKDFLKYRKKGYDRVVMNPPFSKQQDIDHVRHAFQLLKPGGRLVAVMSAGTRFRGNKKAVAFRQALEEHGGVIEDLPEESFKESGTSIHTLVVTVDKPGGTS